MRTECTDRPDYYKRWVPRAVHRIAGEEVDQETLEGAANHSLESEEGEDLDIALSEMREPLGWIMGLQ